MIIYIVDVDDSFLSVSLKKEILELTPTRIWGQKSIFQGDQVIKHDFTQPLSGAVYCKRVNP